jgi:HD-GYP domain-containing protein (c-di-GMP phosphodiesterase class II)
MLRVDLRNAKPGMELALPVRHPKAANQTLLKVGYALEPKTADRLLDMGVRSVWVRYPSLDFLDGYVSSEVVQAQAEVMNDISDTFEAVQRRSTAKMNYDSYTKSIGKMIDALLGNPQAAVFLGDMDGDGADMMRHASTVSYMAVLIGLKLEGYMVKQRKHVDPARAKEVNNLGVGAMLHDIGMLKLDPDVRAAYESTGDDTAPAFRAHTSLGYEQVRGNVEPSAATVVLNHHQRFDGTGYAGEQVPVLEGQRIHIFARIVALADAFDTLQFPAYGESRPTAGVLKYLVEPDIAAGFDPQVMRALMTVVPPFAPGSILRLSDGNWAVAVDHNANEPCRPTVQIIPDPTSDGATEAPGGANIDLAEEPEELKVVECDGHDVADLQFEMPAALRSDHLAALWS